MEIVRSVTIDAATVRQRGRQLGKIGCGNIRPRRIKHPERSTCQLHIAHHLGEVVDFAALAKRLGMGYTLFRRCFREYNGMAPLEYQIALRIRRAMHLLTSTNIPVGQIASETGFKTAAYFSKFFHERTGSSPTQLRRTHFRTGPDQ